MSTRACYRFVDEHGTSTVYVHSDGYPSWAWRYFADTLKNGLAWTLPRFEADEFAAAFVAANKLRPGSVRLMDRWNRAGDIEYLYKLTQNNGVLIIKIEAVSLPYGAPIWPSRWHRETLYHGPLHRWIFAKGDLGNMRSAGRKIGSINALLQGQDQ